MSDIGKAAGLAFMAAALYGMWFVSSVWYLRDFWRVIVYGAISPQWPWLTNLAWFGVVLAGIAFSCTILLLLIFRTLGLRESGGMILETERGIRRGAMPGAERLRGELE